MRFGRPAGQGIRTAPRDALLADSTPPSRSAGWPSASIAPGIRWARWPAWGSAAHRGLMQGKSGGAVARHVSAHRPGQRHSGLSGGAGAHRRPQRKRRRSGRRAAHSGIVGRYAVPFPALSLIFALFTLGTADAFVVLRPGTGARGVAGVLAMLMVFNLVYAGVAGPAGDCRTGWGGRASSWLDGRSMRSSIWAGCTRRPGGWWPLYRLGPLPRPGGGNARAYVADLAGEAQRGRPMALITPWSVLRTLPASLIAGVLWQGAGNWAVRAGGAVFVRRGAGRVAVLLFRLTMPASAIAENAG